MDPITLIVSALTIAATEALKKTGSSVAEDAYKALKNKIIRAFPVGENEKAGEVRPIEKKLEYLEANPESYKGIFIDDIRGRFSESDLKELVAEAERLESILKNNAKSSIQSNTVSNSQGTIIGKKIEGNTINIKVSK